MSRMFISEKKVNITIAFLAMIAIGSVQWSMHPFYTNDQLVMRDIASGVYTGANDGHLVYIMYLLGIVLAILYRVCPIIPWYDFLMLSIYPACAFLTVYQLVSRTKKLLMKSLVGAIATLLYVFIHLWFITQNEYTVNSGILSATAILWILLGRYEKKRQYLPAVVCLILSLCLRKQMFLLIVPITMLAVLLSLIGKSKKARNTQIKMVLVVIAVGAICFLIEAMAYNSLSWKEFKKYNQSRTELVDFYGFPSYEGISEELKDAEISELQYLMLQQNIGLTPGINADKLEKVAEVSKNVYQKNHPRWPITEETKYNIRIELHNLKESIVGKSLFVVLVIVMVLGIVLVIHRKVRGLLYSIATGFVLAYMMAVICYFTAIGRYPERISYPLYYSVLVFLVGVVGLEWSAMDIRTINVKVLLRTIAIAGICACCVAVSISAKQTVISVKDNSKYWAEYIKEAESIQDYCEYNNSFVYYIDGSVANYACDYILGNTYGVQKNYITLGYWTLGSKLFDSRCRNAGVTELYSDLLSSDNVFFIQTANTNVIFGDDDKHEEVDSLVTPVRELRVISYAK